MKEHASTGVVPADAAVEKLVNELQAWPTAML